MSGRVNPTPPKKRTRHCLNAQRQPLWDVLRDILAWHDRGTRYGIRVDDDGLLLAGEPGVQLTWMDAKVGDWVVTPRQGKAVEINALWYNVLRILGELEGKLGDREVGHELAKRAERVRRRFNRLFWNEEAGCLYDVVDADAGRLSAFPRSLSRTPLAGWPPRDVSSLPAAASLSPYPWSTGPRERRHLLGSSQT